MISPTGKRYVCDIHDPTRAKVLLGCFGNYPEINIVSQDPSVVKAVTHYNKEILLNYGPALPTREIIFIISHPALTTGTRWIQPGRRLQGLSQFSSRWKSYCKDLYDR
jgi:hypothetical protein